MIRRRVLCTFGGAGLLAAHCSGRAQIGKVRRRVGLLAGGSAASTNGYWAEFRRGMAELGWIEGDNVDYRIVYADGDLRRLDALASALVAQEVELIVTSTTQPARAAHSAAPALPIVMAVASNVVENGLVASLARPGGSVTGLSIPYEEVLGKTIEFLHEMVPGARRIAVLQAGGSITTDPGWSAMQRAGSALGLQMQRYVVFDPERILPTVESIVRARQQAVMVPGDSMFLANRQPLHALLRSARLPTATTLREHALDGALFSFGTKLNDMFRYVAKYADKILRGARPAELPIEQPALFELVINLNTAKSLGIVVPQSLLQRADEVL